jgi:hypothetical protein
LEARKLGSLAVGALVAKEAGMGKLEIMQQWTEPSFEEIDMNAEIGGYQGEAPPFASALFSEDNSDEE